MSRLSRLCPFAAGDYRYFDDTLENENPSRLENENPSHAMQLVVAQLLVFMMYLPLMMMMPPMT
jgi:hypothetical protein